MKLKFSKNLEAYSLVIRKGNKIICAGVGTKNPYGVYIPFPETHTVRTMLFNGKMHTVSMTVPAGIRKYGACRVLTDIQGK